MRTPVGQGGVAFVASAPVDSKSAGEVNGDGSDCESVSAVSLGFSSKFFTQWLSSTSPNTLARPFNLCDRWTVGACSLKLSASCLKLSAISSLPPRAEIVLCRSAARTSSGLLAVTICKPMSSRASAELPAPASAPASAEQPAPASAPGSKRRAAWALLLLPPAWHFRACARANSFSESAIRGSPLDMTASIPAVLRISTSWDPTEAVTSKHLPRKPCARSSVTSSVPTRYSLLSRSRFWSRIRLAAIRGRCACIDISLCAFETHCRTWLRSRVHVCVQPPEGQVDERVQLRLVSADPARACHVDRQHVLAERTHVVQQQPLVVYANDFELLLVCTRLKMRPAQGRRHARAGGLAEVKRCEISVRLCCRAQPRSPLGRLGSDPYRVQSEPVAGLCARLANKACVENADALLFAQLGQARLVPVGHGRVQPRATQLRPDVQRAARIPVLACIRQSLFDDDLEQRRVAGASKCRDLVCRTLCRISHTSITRLPAGARGSITHVERDGGSLIPNRAAQHHIEVSDNHPGIVLVAGEVDEHLLPMAPLDRGIEQTQIIRLCGLPTGRRCTGEEIRRHQAFHYVHRPTGRVMLCLQVCKLALHLLVKIKRSGPKPRSPLERRWSATATGGDRQCPLVTSGNLAWHFQLYILCLDIAGRFIEHQEPPSCRVQAAARACHAQHPNDQQTASTECAAPQ
eukprot:7391924-Prymnesium_polylepis.2